jgi:exodeoxyribonuclease III
MAAGWVDSFRHFVADGGHYTWWRQWGEARAQNVGWRIDYVLASPGALPFLRDAFIDAQVLGSDHCPVGVKLDSAVLG